VAPPGEGRQVVGEGRGSGQSRSVVAQHIKSRPHTAARHGQTPCYVIRKGPKRPRSPNKAETIGRGVKASYRPFERTASAKETTDRQTTRGERTNGGILHSNSGQGYCYLARRTSRGDKTMAIVAHRRRRRAERRIVQRNGPRLRHTRPDAHARKTTSLHLYQQSQQTD